MLLVVFNENHSSSLRWQIHWSYVDGKRHTEH
jgi:hypothetical protein